MVNSQAPAYQAESDAPLDFDAVVIGAGVSGLYQLYKLRELGLKTLVLEDGSNVGGTWYWNRYPGARFDSESWTYGYSFSDELLQEWNWEEHFASAPETERYLNYVADKFDLRRDIQFRSRVSAAQYNEETRGWDVTLEDDRRYHSRFLITAIGVLSAPTLPRISGVDTFKGQSCHTAHWPKEQVNFEGKRVAVIGTGATGVQTIQTIAKEVGQLTVFQRTPNWCAPLHNSRITDEQMRQIRDRYAEIFARCHETPGCFIHCPDPRSALEVTAEEREAFFEKLYGEPGFGIWQGNFRDILVDREANALISDFVARKIRQRVKDPAVAEKLIPNESRLRHPPPAARDALLRGLQSAERHAGRHQRNADRVHHADRNQDQRCRARIRHDHLRDRLRRDHRCFRPYRYQGRRWMPAEGQMERRAADLPRRPGRRLPEHVDGDGPARRPRQLSARRRI